VLTKRLAERALSFAGILMLLTAVARAEVSPSESLGAGLVRPSGQVHDFRADRLETLNRRLGLKAGFALTIQRPIAPEPIEPNPQGRNPESRSPGSLVIVALVGIGTIGGARSTRRVGLAWAPDWVHTSGPQQIGHSTVFDVSGDFDPFVERPFECPAPGFFWSLNPCLIPLESESVFLRVAPRGPPACA
jgi:hypothetical protein